VFRSLPLTSRSPAHSHCTMSKSKELASYTRSEPEEGKSRANFNKTFTCLTESLEQGAEVVIHVGVGESFCELTLNTSDPHARSVTVGALMKAHTAYKPTPVSTKLVGRWLSAIASQTRCTEKKNTIKRKKAELHAEEKEAEYFEATKAAQAALDQDTQEEDVGADTPVDKEPTEPTAKRPAMGGMNSFRPWG
jgi:hypothetical protein